MTLYDPATAGVMKTIKFPYEVNDMVWDSNHCLWFATGQRAALDFGVLECVKFVGKRMSRVYSAAVASQNAFAVALAPDGSKMATGGADGIVTILDTDEMVCTGTLDRLECVFPTADVRCCFRGEGSRPCPCALCACVSVLGGRQKPRARHQLFSGQPVLGCGV